MDDQSPLNLHRKYIDRIDRTIVALLSERMRLGQMVGTIKRERAWPTRMAEREAEVMATVRAAAARPLSPECAQRIFALIIEETSAVQEGVLDAGERCDDGC